MTRITHVSDCIVHCTRPLQIVVRTGVYLAQEVANVDAAHWVHLRERHDAREGDLASVFVRHIPANLNDFVIFLQIIDGHWHVVVACTDLREVFCIAFFQHKYVLLVDFHQECCKCA